MDVTSVHYHATRNPLSLASWRAAQASAQAAADHIQRKADFFKAVADQKEKQDATG